MKEQVRAAGPALEMLVGQFSQPLACLRELVQNAIDAGSNQVEVRLTQVARPKPDLWLVDEGVGRVYWLFQRRLIDEEVGLIPFGFRLAVDCPSLHPEQRPRQDLLSKCHAFLREWLGVPRPSLWGHWQHWFGVDMPEAVGLALRGQRWFDTTRGWRSWNELMEQPEIWLFPDRNRAFPPYMTVVFDRDQARQTAELFLGHPRGHDVRETEQELNLHAAQEAQRQLVQQRSRRLQGLRHRVKTELGEIGLSGSNTRDVWLLSQEGEALVKNLPAGLVGFVIDSNSVRLEQGVALKLETRDDLLEKVADLLIARMEGGALKPCEIELVAEVCQRVSRLDSLRWIECADGSYASLQQLRHEAEEHGELLYWPRNFRWRVGGPALLPILATPLLLEVVGRACQVPLRLCPPPLLYREISLRGFKEALCAMKLPLLSGIRDRLAGAPPPSPEVGQALLQALRRRASQLLSGTARTVCLHHLDKARFRPGLERLWMFEGDLCLCSDHRLLRDWLGAEEPPLEVQSSLLLSLVCGCNALSLPFTDEMEREFLEQLARDMVDSLPRVAT